MAEQYGTITTNACDAAIAQFMAGDDQVLFTQLAVGDSGGAYYEPSKSQTALRGEKWRGTCSVSYDPGNQKRVIITANIPATVGGFQIREAGVFDAANVMMIVSKQPLSDKVSPDSGASKDVTIRLYAEVVDQTAVQIVVDPSADNVKRPEFLAHANNVDLHTSAAEKAAIAAHLADKVVHVTAAERTAWNGKATTTHYTATLTVAGWSATAPFTQTVSVPGIVATDMPLIGPVLSATAATAAAQREAWNCVSKAAAGAGAITFTCLEEKPTVAIPIQIKVVN